MKKTTFYFISFFLILIGCSNDAKNEIKKGNRLEKENDLAQQMINGKVKIIETSKFSVVEKFGEVQTSSLGKIIEMYNENGNKIEEISYDSDGSLKRKYTRKYDDNGDWVELNCFGADGNLEYKWKTRHNEYGEEIEKNRYDTDGILEKSIKYEYKYDENGSLIEVNDIVDGSFDGRNLFMYNEKGKKIAQHTYDSHSRLQNKYTYKYDEEGYIKESNYLDSDGRLEIRFTYKYDENGNLIESNTYNFEERLVSQSYYEYKYDKKDNWTRCTGFDENKQAILIQERTIEYYN